MPEYGQYFTNLVNLSTLIFVFGLFAGAVISVFLVWVFFFARFVVQGFQASDQVKVVCSRSGGACASTASVADGGVQSRPAVDADHA